MNRSSRLPFLLGALALAFSACDSNDPPAGNDGEFERGCEQSTAVPVDSKGTYLRTNDDRANSPTVIRLSDVNVTPGMRVTLRRLGEYQYDGQGNRLLTFEEMAGVFSSSSVLLSSEQLNRISGAISAGGPRIVTPATLRGSLPTDIPQDFLIETTTIVVPAGAQYLFVTPVDSFFEDNIDEDDDYRVCITPA